MSDYPDYPVPQPGDLWEWIGSKPVPRLFGLVVSAKVREADGGCWVLASNNNYKRLTVWNYFTPDRFVLVSRPEP